MEKRIYGLYPGYIKNTLDIDKLSASEIFLAIRNYSSFIYNVKNIVQENADNVDLSEEEYTFDYLVYYTRHFGVEFPEPEEGKRIVITDSFMDWYKTYYDYYKNILSDEQYESLENDFVKRLCLKIPK